MLYSCACATIFICEVARFVRFMGLERAGGYILLCLLLARYAGYHALVAKCCSGGWIDLGLYLTNFVSVVVAVMRQFSVPRRLSVCSPQAHEKDELCRV